MSYALPTIEDFKTHFSRDFSYGDGNRSVTDSDLSKALKIASVKIPIALFSSQDEFDVAFFYLMAHFLVVEPHPSIKSAWIANSHSVGSVSESFSVPEKILANPFYSMLAKTGYGQNYLMIVYPKLSGQMFTVMGRTHP